MDNYQITSYSGAEIEALLVKIDELNAATPEADGLMSAADKAKLDGVNSGAEVNRINRIMLGETEIAPTEKVVTLPLDPAPVLNGTKLLLSGAVYHALTNYYTKAQVDALISGIKQFSAVVVATLPESGEQFILYLVGPTGTGADKYEEYIWNNDAWLKIGDTSIDLSGYATKEELSQLGQEFNKDDIALRGDSFPFIDGYYYKSSDNTIVANASFSYCKVGKCKAGDRFKITANNRGSASALLYVEVPDDGSANVESSISRMGGEVYTITKDCTFYVNTFTSEQHSVFYLLGALVELNAELVELNAEILENECISSIYADAFGYSNFQYNAAGLLTSATIKWFDGTVGQMSITYNADKSIDFITYTYGDTTYKYQMAYSNGILVSTTVSKL